MVKRFRILIITPDDSKGGLQIYSKNLQKLFKKSAILKKIEFKQQYLQYKFKELNSRMFHETDLVHINYDTSSYFDHTNLFLIAKAHIALLISLRNSKKPVVFTMHGLFDNYYVSIIVICLSIVFLVLLLNLSRVSVIFHSHNEAELYRSLLPWHSQQIIFIPHMVYPLTDNKITLGRKKHKTVIFGTLGYIGRWKGQLSILKLMLKLRSQFRNFKYIIAGLEAQQLYATKCRNFIIQNNMQSYVYYDSRFLSDREYNRYLREIDIYCAHHSRVRHSSSGTIMQAIFHKKTVLVKNIPFIYNPEITKYVTIANSDEQYLEILKSILLKKFQTKNSKNVVNESWKVTINNSVVKSYSNLYMKLLNLN